MPEFPECNGMAHTAQQVIPPHSNQYGLKIYPHAAGANKLTDAQSFLTNNGSPYIPLHPTSISVIGKHLFIKLPGTCILVLHFALHGLLATFTAEETELTLLCIQRNLPPTCPLLIQSTNPHHKSIAIIDRNKLASMNFMAINPLNSFRPRDFILPIQWTGPDPLLEQASFEAGIRGLGWNGELVHNGSPVYQFITTQ